MKWVKFLTYIFIPSFLLAQMFVNPLQTLPGDDAIGMAVMDQNEATIARGDNQYLAVWTDQRSKAVEVQSGRDIYGAILDASGNISSTLIVAKEGPDDWQPQVFWAGDKWLVVWETYGLSSGSYYSSYIKAIRVSSDGLLLDSNPITVYGYPFSGSVTWAAACDSSNLMVVIQGSSSGENDIIAVKVDGNGTVSSPQTLIASTYYLRSDFALGSSQGHFLFVYDDNGPQRGVIFDNNLNLTAGPFDVASSSAARNRVVNGYPYFLYTCRESGDVVARRITTSGTILDNPAINVSQGNSPYSSSNRHFALWNGSFWYVTWQDNTDLRIARLLTDGTLQDPGGQSVPNANNGYSTDRINGGIQTVWTEDYDSEQSLDTWTTPIDQNFNKGTDLALSTGTPAQFQTDIATDGTDYMLVFTHKTDTNFRVLRQLVDGSGNTIESQPVQLDEGLISDNGPGKPAVAWNGSLYLIVWAKLDTIWGQRFNANGTAIDAQPFFIMKGFGPDVDALGDVFLVVGKYYVNSVQFVHPFAIRVQGSTGAILDSSPILLGQYYVRYISVVATNTNWFVAWQRNFTHDDTRGELMANFVETDGSIGTEYRLTGLFTTTMYHGPKLAFDGNKILMVYEDEVSSSTTTDIVAMPILPDGTTQTAINVNQMNDDQYRPAVCFDGENFVIIWQDSRNNDSELDMLDQRSQIFFTRLSPDGTVLDGNGIEFANGSRPAMYPAVAGKNGQALLVGSILMNDATYNSYHIQTALMDEGNPSALNESRNIPHEFALLPNFPNPFNPTTTISFYLPQNTRITLLVQNARGQRVATLIDGFQDKGKHTIQFDGSNLASGTYFYILKARNFKAVRKMQLVK